VLLSLRRRRNVRGRVFSAVTGIVTHKNTGIYDKNNSDNAILIIPAVSAGRQIYSVKSLNAKKPPFPAVSACFSVEGKNDKIEKIEMTARNQTPL
jgi:hypothetical protein